MRKGHILFFFITPHNCYKTRACFFFLLQDFKVGDRVLAKWTDCKMYEAKVTGILPSGKIFHVFTLENELIKE